MYLSLIAYSNVGIHPFRNFCKKFEILTYLLVTIFTIIWILLRLYLTETNSDEIIIDKFWHQTFIKKSDNTRNKEVL